MFNPSQFETLEQIETFLLAADVFLLDHRLPGPDKAKWLRDRLLHFHYRDLSRAQQGLLRKFFGVITGYSPAQLSRHIRTYRDGTSIRKPQQRHCFPTTYTHADIELLVETDNIHKRLNGAAMKKIFHKEYMRGDRRYERLQRISVSRLYDLRQHRRYREEALHIEKTKPVQVPIGERRKPEPNGKPGFLRVDTVHQGDLDLEKGVYHVNFVDEVIQWEVICATEQISESCMETVLNGALPLFPFVPCNYHSDNGGENINYTVAALLKKLDISQTKGRPRRSNDNGLVETKNGSIIRKHMGHHHIPQPFAARINRFYREHLIPYLNFHRPCAFPIVKVLKNGKKKVIYPPENYRTPYEKLKSLPNWQQYLRPGVTEEMLEAQANAKTPNQAAREMQMAKDELEKVIHMRLPEEMS
jgi:transposase InsO family protein